MITYISGPITGIPNGNKEKFDEVEKLLLKDNHIVINPTKTPEGLTYNNYMDISFAQIRACDCVFALIGWEKSKGAIAEISYAEALKIPVFCQEVKNV